MLGTDSFGPEISFHSNRTNETITWLEARTEPSDYWEVPDLRKWIPMNCCQLTQFFSLVNRI